MRRPNLILIVAGQHRWDCAGYAGNADLRTPNLDALAAHGVNFTRAVCQYPLAASSQATLLSGQYAVGHGVKTAGAPLPMGTALLPRMLRQAGYQTACVGNVHLERPESDYGFDVARLAGTGGGDDDYQRWLDEQDSSAGASEPLPESNHSTTWISSAAVRFVQAAQEPFFLMLAFLKPRAPCEPPAPWDRLYDPSQLRLPADWREAPGVLTEAAFRQMLADYYACISQIDYQIGRLLATLTSRGFTNNVFVYCADHGDYMGQHGLTGADGPPYDSLLRVPFVAAGLRGQRRGEADASLVQLTDVAPTLLEAAGLEPPSEMEGASLVPLLRNSQVSLRAHAFCEAPGDARILWSPRYKLIESPHDNGGYFFDIEKDALESESLYGTAQAAEAQRELMSALERTSG